MIKEVNFTEELTNLLIHFAILIQTIDLVTCTKGNACFAYKQY